MKRKRNDPSGVADISIPVLGKKENQRFPVRREMQRQSNANENALSAPRGSSLPFKSVYHEPMCQRSIDGLAGIRIDPVKLAQSLLIECTVTLTAIGRSFMRRVRLREMHDRVTHCLWNSTPAATTIPFAVAFGAVSAVAVEIGNPIIHSGITIVIHLRRKGMQRDQLRKMMVVGLFFGAMLVALNAMAGESVNVEGEVNDNYQIVGSNGQVYDIADTEKGNELAEKHIGEKVKVTGTLEKSDDYQVIDVTTFQPLAE